MDNNQNQREYIENIVKTAITQANKYQSPDTNKTFNLRQINLRLADVVIIVGVIISVITAFTTNYFTITSYIDNSKKAIQKLEIQVKTIQTFKLETKMLLEKHKETLKRLESNTKLAQRTSIDASDQVQDVYSNVNTLLNKIDDLEDSIKELEKQN